MGQADAVKKVLALMMLSAAAMPAWADPSPVDILSTNSCRVIIGTLASVQSDGSRLGTDIMLTNILPSPAPEPLIHNGTVMAIIPADAMKAFPPLDGYVGQQVAVWDTVSGGFRGAPRAMQIAMPAQLELLSAALADPKHSWCYLPAFKRRYG